VSPFSSRPRPSLCLLPALLLALPANAAAGTALEWARIGHLVLFSGVLAVLEAGLLERLFPANRRRTLPLLLVGNYLAGWLALHFLGHVPAEGGSLTLQTAWTWFWGAIFLSFLLGLLVEWGFVYLALLPGPRRLEQSFLGTLAVQLLAFLVLAIYYVGPAHFSLYTHADQVRLNDLDPPAEAVAFYYSPREGRVCRTQLVRVTAEPVSDWHSSRSEVRLLWRPHPKKTGRWDLVAFLPPGEGGQSGEVVEILTGLHGRATLAAGQLRQTRFNRAPSFGHAGVPRGMFAVPSVPDEASRNWRAFLHFWPGEGLLVRATDESRHYRLAFATPFGTLGFSHGTHLPGDLVLCQVGTEIALVDLETRRVARLVDGVSPVVLLSPE